MHHIVGDRKGRSHNAIDPSAGVGFATMWARPIHLFERRKQTLSTATLTPETADSTVRRQFAPIPFTSVTIEDSFWAPKRVVNRERTIPHIYRQLLETGRIDAFRPDWNPGPEITARGTGWGGTHVMFWDSDVAKWIEAASFSLAKTPDPQLDAQLDALIELIAGAQHADGYLNT